MTKLQKALNEQKYRAKMVKGKHGWIVKGMLFSTLALGAIGINSIDVHADTWTANTAEEIATRLDINSGRYTFVTGDTFWEIGNVLNIQPTKLMELNGFKEGTQYSVPVGTVITWDGNHVTVKDAEGNVVSDSIIKDEDKVDPNKTVAGQATDTPKTPVQSDNNGNVVNGSTNTNNTVDGNNSSNSNNSNNNGNGGTNEEKPTPTPEPEVKKFTVSVLHKDEEGNILLKESDVKVDEDSTFTANAKEFDGYTLVGNATQEITVKENTTITFIYKKNETPTPPVETEKFDITIKYVDTEGNELATADVIKVEKGESYTATAKNIEGYTLEGELTQTITADSNKEITFVYKKNAEEVQKFKVVVEHKTEDGTILDKEDAVKVEEGQVFTANAKTFDGYTLKGSTTQSIKVTSDTTITFTYVKDATPVVKYKVTVEHVDLEGNILETESAVEIEEGKTFTAQSKEFNGYTLEGNSTQTISVSKDSTITFKYKKDAVAPEVNKTELQNLYNTVKDTVKGNYTDASWTTFQTALTNAKTTLDNTNATQTQVDTAKNNLQTAFDNLAEKPAPVEKFNVTVTHLGSDGTTLETETPVEVEKGKQFTANAKTFNGYTLNGNATQTITVNGDATITFNYTKDAVEEDLQAIANQIAGSALSNVNAYRKSVQPGLVNLASNGALQSGTTTRAVEIATLYDHQRPSGADFDTAVYEAGYQGQAVNENIGRFQNTSLEWLKSDGAQQMVNAWINSVGHANNMLNSGINEGAVGISITANSDGSYSMYAVFIGGYDATKPVGGYKVSVEHWSDTGEFFGSEEKTVFDRNFKAEPDQWVLDQGYKVKSGTETVVLPEDNEAYTTVKVIYTKATKNARSLAPEATVESTVESSSVEEPTTEESTVESIVTEEQEPTDKSTLIEAYDVSNTLSEEHYSLTSWAKLILAKADAKSVFDNANATQAEIDQATTNLKNAINHLN
ncbi:hypothetical protein K4E_00920 [Enterococcus thailandicus]|nr:hypothetical protein K4E_00920 [Enterococcus thailandicus]